MKRYILVAGSFTYLHAGHKALIKQTFKEKEIPLVCLASDEFLIKKYGKILIPFKERKKELVKYLNHYKKKFILKIFNHKYDFAATDDSIVKISAVDKTIQNVIEINKIRKKKNLKELKIIHVKMLKDDLDRPISSSNILIGEINLNGNLFLKPPFNEFKLNKKDYPILRKPWGKIVHPEKINHQSNDLIFAIGDMSTQNLLKFGINPNLAIIDHKINRKPLISVEKVRSTDFKNLIKTTNPASTISIDSFKKLSNLFKQQKLNQTLVIVDGEDDLLTLLVILLAPLNSYVYYGLPNKGLVQIKISLQVKNKARRIIY